MEHASPIRKWLFLPPSHLDVSGDSDDMLFLPIGITSNGTLLLGRREIDEVNKNLIFTQNLSLFQMSDVYLLGVIGINSKYQFRLSENCTVLNVYYLTSEYIILGQVFLRGPLSSWQSSLHSGDAIEVMDFQVTTSNGQFILHSRASSTIYLLSSPDDTKKLSMRSVTMNEECRKCVNSIRNAYEFIVSNMN